MIVYPDWSSSHGYYFVGDTVKHLGYSYRGHNGYITSEPGVTPNWQQDWYLIPNSANIISPVNYVLNSTYAAFTSADSNSIWTLPIGVSTNWQTLDLSPNTYNTALGPTTGLFIQGDYLVSTMWDSSTAPLGTLTLEQSLDNINWQVINTWGITNTTDGNISHSDSAPTVGAWYRLNCTKSSGGTKTMRLESVNSTINIPFKISSYVNSQQVIGRPVMPNNQELPYNLIGINTASYRPPAFSNENGFPKTVTYHEDRIWWGGISSQPGRLWGSQTDNFYTYLLGTGATDGLDITLGSTATNKIVWAKSFNKTLLVGTEGEIFTVDSGAQDLTLQASNIRARLTGKYGCSNIPGIATGMSMLYVQRGYKRLREFSYQFTTDAYTSPDMTLLAEHASQDGFIQGAYQNNLEPIYWLTTQKGALGGFSYDREQDITAWHRHITGDRAKYYSYPTDITVYPDKFISVSTIFGQNNLVDEVWFCVQRVVNGQLKYYIERFNPDTYNFVYGGSWLNMPDSSTWKFMDCSTTSTSAGIINGNTVYTGFDQLEGRTVDIVPVGGQNYVYNPTVVSNGTVTVPGSANSSVINAGLPIFSIYVPPRIEMSLQNGSIQGRKTRIDRLSFKTWRSYGGAFTTFNNTITSAALAQNSYQLKPLITDNFSPINYNNFSYDLSFDYPKPATSNHDASYTGQTMENYPDSDYNENTLLTIVNYEARPFNLLSLVQKIEVSGN